MRDDPRFSFVATNGQRLHVAQAGPEDGPLVILLHGFPEFWYGWRKQIPALAAAGFCVWVPDQRGYGFSDKPARISDYRLDKLAADVAGLIAASGRRRAAVIGHDWGGAVGWWLAANNPEVVEQLAIINVPHPQVMRRMIFTDPRQTLRSWYMFAFQLPWLPEWLARRNNWQALVEGLSATSRAGTFTTDDFDRYRSAWSQAGAYTAMLNWYRAMFRYGAPAPRNFRIMPRTLVLWGKQDKFMRPEAAEASLALCDNGKLLMYETATHWIAHEEPEEVNAQLIRFLKPTLRRSPGRGCVTASCPPTDTQKTAEIKTTMPDR
jgi:pimeloyl-ACP methyl ester carboxylesterase